MSHGTWTAILAVAIVLVLGGIIGLCIDGRQQAEPYTLVIENLQTKTPFLTIENVVEHLYHYQRRHLEFKCKGEDFLADWTHIDIPEGIMIRIKKVPMKKAWEQ